MPALYVNAVFDQLFTWIPFGCFWVAFMWLVTRGEPSQGERVWRTRVAWAFLAYGAIGILAWPFAYYGHFQFRNMGWVWMNYSYPVVGWLPLLGVVIGGLQLRPGRAYARGRFARRR